MKLEQRLCLLLAVVCQTLLVTLLQVTQCEGACTQLLVPSYGRLLLESADITQSQNAVNISTGDSVVIQCAEGYLLTHTLSNATLSAAQSVTTCSGSGQWTLDIKNLSCVRQIASPVLSNFIIMIIVAATLAVVCLLLLTTTIACAVRAQRLKRELLEATYVENEIAFARSQGAFTLSNPLAVVKDEEPTTKPLYLTPDEMSEFEEKQKI